MTWQDDAACRAPGVNIEWFFPKRGETAEMAKMVCFTCPVRAQCADLGRGERHGVWGGMVKGRPSQRSRQRSRKRRAA